MKSLSQSVIPKKEKQTEQSRQNYTDTIKEKTYDFGWPLRKHSEATIMNEVNECAIDEGKI